MRFGIDLGGTKTEIIALHDDGRELYRKRVETSRDNYPSILKMLVALVEEAESVTGMRGTVGIGIPGTLSRQTGLIKNANTTVLIGHALDQDLGRLLNREVRIMNDANCLALSEAVDGAGSGHRLVFAVILGTGCGSGIAIDGRPWDGLNLVAGEWGHNPLPWMAAGEFPGPPCWCGKSGCIETWISGTGFARDYAQATGKQMKAEKIIECFRSGDMQARAAFDRYVSRLSRALAHVINILDPDVIVLAGGMSNVDELYSVVPPLLADSVFGREVATPVVRNKHGDSSGVRGAAWLWPRNK